MVESDSHSVRHILSFGGGVNTVALMLILVEQGWPLDEVVFADTGGEAPETYDYLSHVKLYLEKNRVPFTVVAKRVLDTDLFGTCWRRAVIPSVMWRWCTRDFKVTPIHDYYASLQVHVQQYMGIAYDEIHRMKDSRVSFITNLYPLIDQKLTRVDCLSIIQESGLPIPVKSGCFFCPFNSGQRWNWLLKAHPSLYEKAVALEEHSKHFPRQRLTDQMYRETSNVTLRQLRIILKSGVRDLGEMKDVPCGGECMV